MKQNKKSIPLTITKRYNGVECIYTLTQVIPNKETITPIESFDNVTIFANIVNKYFVFGQNRKCSRAEIQTILQENASCDENIRLAGFDFTLSNLQYCEQYRSFLKYIASLDGVKPTKLGDRYTRYRGFKGIGINNI